MSEEYTSKDVEERKLLTIGWYPKDLKQICYIGMGDMNISIQEVLKRKIEFTLKGCFLLNQHIYKGFIHLAIRILRQYDAKNGTDLLRSLEAFLENDCNTMETARLLAVHRNSMQYRLRRIDELTSVKLGDFNTRLHLILSFRMMQVETNERKTEHERI